MNPAQGESTYGNRDHKSLAQTMDEFAYALNDTMASRRGNVVIPFCRFVQLGGEAPLSLEHACSVHHRHHPVPILVIPGNHDAASPESLALERSAVPRSVSNWHMPPGPVEVDELPHGISLVLVDDDAFERAADAALLTNSLASAHGPWRIVLIHKPLRDDAPSRLVRQAIERSGVPVQLLLAGHEHSLPRLREGDVLVLWGSPEDLERGENRLLMG